MLNKTKLVDKIVVINGSKAVSKQSYYNFQILFKKS